MAKLDLDRCLIGTKINRYFTVSFGCFPYPARNIRIENLDRRRRIECCVSGLFLTFRTVAFWLFPFGIETKSRSIIKTNIDWLTCVLSGALRELEIFRRRSHTDRARNIPVISPALRPKVAYRHHAELTNILAVMK